MITKTLSIPDLFFAQYKTALARAYPIPVDSETDEPLYTEGQWVLEDFKKQTRQRLATLKSKASAMDARDSIAVNDEDISIT